MPKLHSSALSYPGLLFKAAFFFRRNTHTGDLVSITVSLLLFYVGRESIIPSFRRCLSHWRHWSYKDEKTDVLSILLGLLHVPKCTGR